MLKGPIPAYVDPRKLADRAAVIEGEIELTRFARLCSAVKIDGNMQVYVHAKFVFGRDEQHTVVFHSSLDVEVAMVCQRCLELVKLPIHSECDYAVVNEGGNSQHLPKEYEVLEVGEDPLDLLALVEDELLLALPIVPLHDPNDCQAPGAQPPQGDQADRPNPFSVLAQLKRDPNV